MVKERFVMAARSEKNVEEQSYIKYKGQWPRCGYRMISQLTGPLTPNSLA